ncbi:MAG: nickel pincer cofactor biosynthesis protein LarC [Candidatus Hodarchaeaceae archaeon]|nr:nickel pincer cofactor biosynthesis protein LarC [Candidatus Hodarchaeaceae archaeon]
MKAAFIDCSTAGISGDMLTAALIDAGAPAKKVKTAMTTAGKPFGGVKVSMKHVNVSGIGATRMDVVTSDEGGRGYFDIVGQLEELILPERVRAASLKALAVLARAEAKVHGEEPGHLILHEVGAADAIADIVGCCTAAHELGLFDREVLASEVAVGGGVAVIGHGKIPLPAPAVLEILKGVPIRGKPIDAELTTPTGAALLVALTDRFVPTFPSMRVEAVGYGAGARRLREVPNVVRVCLGEVSGRAPELQEIGLLETNVDNVSGEVIGYAMEKLFAEGALDVSTTPMVMKKGRPGFLIRVVAKPGDVERLARVLMLQTGTLGVRVLPVARYVLERESSSVKVSIGGRKFNARVKVARERGRLVGFSAEYEDAKKISEKTGIPLRDVVNRIEEAARRKVK